MPLDRALLQYWQVCYDYDQGITNNLTKINRKIDEGRVIKEVNNNKNAQLRMAAGIFDGVRR
jgi:hypothetical protein